MREIVSRYLSSAGIAADLAFGRNVPFAYRCLRVGILESLFIILGGSLYAYLEYVTTISEK